MSVGVAATLAACGGTGAASGTGNGGPVDVLYAGSLTNLMEHQLGPAFERATGYHFVGFAAGSDELASEIADGVRPGDVFVSASPSADRRLTGASGGHHVTWYLTLGSSPLVLGYEPGSPFAHQLRHRPWYDVVTEPGFRLGRTDPALDPKGALSATALTRTARAEHDPALRAVLGTTAGVFPEETLLGRLQTGQLDAGFFYTVEAAAAGLRTVPLSPVHLSATFTVTALHGSAHRAGAVAFVRYLLGPKGRAALARAGMRVATPPPLHGHGLPAGLRSLRVR